MILGAAPRPTDHAEVMPVRINQEHIPIPRGELGIPGCSTRPEAAGSESTEQSALAILNSADHRIDA